MSTTALLLLTLSLPAAPGPAWHDVAALWPGAKVRTVDVRGRKAIVIAPVRRKGEVGFIDKIHRRPFPKLGATVAFSIRLAKDPKDLEGWIRGKTTPEQVRHVVQVLWLPSKRGKKRGEKISKAPGFPLERVVNTGCLGDVCDRGPRLVRLQAVEGDPGLNVVLVSPDGGEGRHGYVLEVGAEGLQQLFEVEGPSALPSEIGCGASTKWKRLRWDKKTSRLLADMARRCDCGAECESHGYPPGEWSGQRALRPIPGTKR